MARISIVNESENGVGTCICVNGAPLSNVLEADLHIGTGNLTTLRVVQVAGPLDISVQGQVVVTERCPYCKSDIGDK